MSKMKSSLYILPCIMTASLCFTAVNANAAMSKKQRAAETRYTAQEHVEMLMTQAIALMANDHKEPAFKLLEQVFSETNLVSDQIDAALILAYADNRLLTKHKRQYYAQFLTKVAMHSPDRPALLRIAGDGYFEEMDLVNASKMYEELTQAKDPNDQDYGHYKLGWVELNQKRPGLAFQRWHSRVLNGKNRSQDLRLAFVRDLGRSWAETVPADPSHTEKVLSLNLTDKEEKEFLYGLAAGMRRLNEQEELPAFRSQIQRTRYAQLVVGNVLTQGVGLGSSPCSVMDWFSTDLAVRKTQIKSVDAELLLPRLNACNYELHKKHGDRWKDSPQTSRLMSFYEELDLKGMKRWAMAAFYKDSGKNVEACEESIEMVREEPAESLKQGKLNEAMDTLIESCRLAIDKNLKELNQKSELVKSFVGLLSTHAQLGILNTQDQKNPLYGLVAYFLKASNFRTQIVNILLASKENDLRKTLIPSQLLDALTDAERVKYGEALLVAYGPQPITTEDSVNSVWIELLRARLSDLVQKKQYQAAYDLLKTFIPFDSVKEALAASPKTAERRVGLWLLWALGVPEEEATLKAGGLQAAKLAISTMATHKVPALALSAKFGLVEDAWANWSTLKTVPNDSKTLLTGVLQNVFEATLIGSFKEKALLANPEGKEILAGVKYVQMPLNETIRKGDSGLKSNSFKGIPEPKFVGDIRAIEALVAKNRAVTSQQLKFTQKLPKLLESSIQDVQAQVESIKKRSWSNIKLGQKAKLVVANTCETLAAKIEGIRFPSGLDEAQVTQWRTQLGDIAGQVKGWQRNLADSGV